MIINISPEHSVVQSYHGEVTVVCGQAQPQLGLHFWRHALQHAVENMVVSLIGSLWFQMNISLCLLYHRHKLTWRLTCRHTRDFSSRYCSILAPSMAPLLLKWMSMYFPKRLELSLRIVLALPKAKWKIEKLKSEFYCFNCKYH